MKYNSEGRIMHLSPRQQVIATVNKWISDCTLPPNGELPSENYIATTANVARGTVRSGLEQLIQDGYLVKRGRKIYVAKKQANPPNVLLQRTIVMIGLPNADEALRMQNTGYLAAIQGGAIAAAAQEGMPALCVDLSALTMADVRDICRNHPAGVLLFHCHELPDNLPRIMELFRENGIPMVASDDNAIYGGMDRIASDHCAGAAMLTEELIKRGRKRIMCFLRGDRPESWVSERIRGYRQAMKEHHLPVLKEPAVAPFIAEYGTWAQEDFQRHTRFFAGCLLEYFDGSANEPDAILARTDWDVPVIAAALRLMNREPGKDVVIAGYDNKFSNCIWNKYEPYRAALTIGKQNTILGKKMVEILRHRIEDTDNKPPFCQLEKPVLIDPASVKPYRSNFTEGD